LKKRSSRRRSHSTFRRSSGGPLFLSILLGLVAGSALAALLVVAGAFIEPLTSGAWLAAAAPIACAMLAGAATGSILHWRKVASPAAVHTGVIGVALFVLAGAQFLRFAEIIVLSRDGGAQVLLYASFWSGLFDFSSFSLTQPHQAAPALAAATQVAGQDGVWAFVIVELALVTGLAWWMAGRALAARLCTSCVAWCVEQRGVVERAADLAAPDLVRQRVAALDWRFLRDLGPARGGPAVRFDLSRCPRCDRSNAVSVMWERPHWRDRCLVDNLRLGSDDMRMLLALVEGEPNAHPAF
jgi:hypothetical protein